MKNGQRTSNAPSLEEIKTRFKEDFAAFDDRFKALRNPPRFPVGVSGKLERLTSEVREETLGTNVPESD